MARPSSLWIALGALLIAALGPGGARAQCSEEAPCDAAGNPCFMDNQCNVGLFCQMDDPFFNFNYCENATGPVNGDLDFCLNALATISSPCFEGQGTCYTDDHCVTFQRLRCVPGAERIGFNPGTSLCLKECIFNWQCRLDLGLRCVEDPNVEFKYCFFPGVDLSAPFTPTPEIPSPAPPNPPPPQPPPQPPPS